MRFTARIYHLLVVGFLGKLFTAYFIEEQRLCESRLFARLRSFKKSEKIANAVKLSMARSFENSLIFLAIESVTASLIYRRLKTYGAFLFSLGSYGVIAGVLQSLVFADAVLDGRRLFICAVILFASLPLLATKETLAEALLTSKLLSPLLFRWLGVSRDTFTKKESYPKRYAVVATLGMILGVLTAFIDPLYYVVVALVAIVVLVIFRYPETGVLLWIACIPLVGFFEHSSILLVCVVLATATSYLIKFIRGKRVFRMKLIDYPILLLSVLYLLGGVFSKGGLSSFHSATMYVVFLLGYFLTFNLIRTHEWVKRCVVTGIVSASGACLVGCVQIFTGTLNPSWLDTDLFANIGTRIVSTFDNPNIFAEYLLLLIPFSVACLLHKNSVRKKIWFGISLLLMLVCLVFTWSRGAWLGLIMGMLIFFVIFSKKTVPVLLGAVLISPFLSWLVPTAVAGRFLSIGNLAESSVSYRISAWHGIIELLNQTWWCGIGVGTAAFEAVYPSVALAGTQAIRHAHSIYLQLLTELGIPGFLVFLLIVFLFLQNCFEYLYQVKNQEGRCFVVAGIAAMTAILVMGITDHIWYSYCIFFLFWTMMALVNSYIQYGFLELERYNGYENNAQNASSIEIRTEAL